MRLLLLIMTGIGFTLGLLCGLLLQLPADGLPASGSNIINDGRNGILGDDRGSSYRSRRSFTDDGAGKSGPSSQAREPGSQAAPNPEIESNPFVSGAQAGRASNNGRTGEGRGGSPHSRDSASANRGHGQAPVAVVKVPAQAERGADSSVNGQSGEPARGGEGRSSKTSSSPPPPPPPPPAVGAAAASSSNNKPITSFTLRLKNTGDKFVVDSAVRRQQEEDAHPLESLPRAGRGDPSSQHVTYSVRDSDNKDAKPSSLDGNNTLSDVVSSGVLWSRGLEDSCPRNKGLDPQEVAAWRRRAAGLQVVAVEEGCGRMQNRLVTFKDGSQACARYRLNTDQIQGEVYSYYLARLLNITNLPPALLVPVDTLSPQWRAVHLEMSMAQWADGRLVVLTRWLDGLSPSYIPQELREDTRRLHPTSDILGKKTHAELCDLLQWSDLIIFDYLTANLDRLVNNMFNRQWNAEMMSNPAHNLERTKTGSLVFLDNESGLFHGYRLLDKYRGYHEALLNSLCVFRESTARAVKALHESQRVGEELHKLFVEGEVHHTHLPRIPEKNAGVLKDRLARVYDQIVKCEGMYASR